MKKKNNNPVSPDPLQTECQSPASIRPVKHAITFIWSAMTKPVLCSLAPYAIKSIHRHADILVIKETNGFAAVVLESDASAKDLLDQVLTGPRREIALESPVLGFLWDDVITGAASVAGLKRLPQHIKAKIEQFGVINHHISPLIYTVGANVEEIGQALGWHLRPNP